MKDLSHYLNPAPRFTRPLLCAAAAMAVLAAWIGAQALERQAAVDAVTWQEDALRRTQVKKPAPLVSKSEFDEQKKWDKLKVERSFSWSPLLTALEKSGNPDIELLEFQPEKASAHVVLRGEAKDEEALLAFLDALTEQRIFQNVHLTHRKIRKRDRLLTIAFEVKAAIAAPALAAAVGK